MNKLHLLKKAENLYCIENFTPDMIAEKLNISRRTVFNWKFQICDLTGGKEMQQLTFAKTRAIDVCITKGGSHAK